jgi:L-amino acid N-acyltransferase YncA
MSWSDLNRRRRWDEMLHIVSMTADDWPAVRRIYEAGIASGQATFETEVPTWEAWNGAQRLDLRFVAVDDDHVIGWIAASNVSDRCSDDGVVEHGVYVAPDRQATGVGGALLGHLITESEAAGIWTIQTGIFPENRASLALHERYGFRTVGRRERLGQLNGSWRDVILVERRSHLIE